MKSSTIIFRVVVFLIVLCMIGFSVLSVSDIFPDILIEPLFCAKWDKKVISRRIVMEKWYLLIVEMCEKNIKNTVALLVSN